MGVYASQLVRVLKAEITGPFVILNGFSLLTHHICSGIFKIKSIQHMEDLSSGCQATAQVVAPSGMSMGNMGNMGGMSMGGMGGNGMTLQSPVPVASVATATTAATTAAPATTVPTTAATTAAATTAAATTVAGTSTETTTEARETSLGSMKRFFVKDTDTY